MKRAATCVLVLAFVGACGDDDSGPPGFGNSDAVVFAVGTDFVGSSVASRVFLPSLAVEQNTLAQVASTDPAVKFVNTAPMPPGLIVILNRFAFDNVTIIDPWTNEVTEQRSTGLGSNPQDAAWVDGTLYVATMGGTGLVALDLSEAGAPPVEIDLGSLDPEDGIPNCHAVELYQGDLYVSCQYRDDNDEFLAARGPGRVAVVDPTDNSLRTTITLTGTPSGRLVRSVDELLIPIADPTFADLTAGCVERISPTGASAGCLVSNEALGGYVTNIAPQFNRFGEGGYIATVVDGFDADDFGATGRLVFFSDENNDVETRSDVGQRIFSMTQCPTGEIIVADATAGLRIYNASAFAELSTSVLDIGAPPVQDGAVCFLGAGASSPTN